MAHDFKCMPKRKLIPWLLKQGCKRIRSSGTSHQVWEAPNGKRFSIVLGNSGAEASRNVMTDIRRALRD